MDDYRGTEIPEKTRMKPEFPIIHSEKSNSVIRQGRHGGKILLFEQIFFILIDVCWSEVPSKPVVLIYILFSAHILLSAMQASVQLKELTTKGIFETAEPGNCKPEHGKVSASFRQGPALKNYSKDSSFESQYGRQLLVRTLRGVVESDQIRINTYFPFIAKKK